MPNAYINTIPDEIQFSIPYEDGGGKSLIVSIDEKKANVIIIQGNDTVLVGIKEIDWLRQVLSDIESIVKMKKDA